MKKDKKEKGYSIVHVDTDDFYLSVVDLILYNMGLDSTKKISNKNETRRFVKDLQAGKTHVDIIISDTYIGIDNEDGRKIAEKIREINSNIVVIGYSIMETGKWADHEAIKSLLDRDRSLIQILERVLERKFNYSGDEVETQPY